LRSQLYSTVAPAFRPLRTGPPLLNVSFALWTGFFGSLYLLGGGSSVAGIRNTFLLWLSGFLLWVCLRGVRSVDGIASGDIVFAVAILFQFVFTILAGNRLDEIVGRWSSEVVERSLGCVLIFVAVGTGTVVLLRGWRAHGRARRSFLCHLNCDWLALSAAFIIMLTVMYQLSLCGFALSKWVDLLLWPRVGYRRFSRVQTPHDVILVRVLFNLVKFAPVMLAIAAMESRDWKRYLVWAPFWFLGLFVVFAMGSRFAVVAQILGVVVYWLLRWRPRISIAVVIFVGFSLVFIALAYLTLLSRGKTVPVAIEEADLFSANALAAAQEDSFTAFVS